MAVPSSGKLELYGDIGTELGVAQSNVTLHGMSQTAGFTPPDAMSEFYGYSPINEPYIDLNAVSLQSDSITNTFYSNSFSLSYDGTKVYFGVASYGSSVYYQYSLSTPYNLANRTLDGTVSLPQSFNYIGAQSWSRDGSVLYNAGYSNGSPPTPVMSTSLSSNFNLLSSSTTTSDLLGVNQNTFVMDWSGDGSIFLKKSDITVDFNSHQVYNVSTPYDLTTANTTTFQDVEIPTRFVSGIQANSIDCQFCNAGYQILCVNYYGYYPNYTNSKASLVSYTLSTPYDLTTITFDKEKDISSNIQDRVIGGLWVDKVTGDIYVPRYDSKRLAHFK